MAAYCFATLVGGALDGMVIETPEGSSSILMPRDDGDVSAGWLHYKARILSEEESIDRTVGDLPIPYDFAGYFR